MNEETDTKTDGAAADLFKAYAPGEQVAIDGVGTATVFPLSARHILTRAREVAALLAVFEAAAKQNVDPFASGVRLLTASGGVILERVSNIMSECVRWPESVAKIDLLDLPHYAFMALFNAWWRQSFEGEAKRDPWRQATKMMEMEASRLGPTT